jgi:hypothetical protein
MNIKLCVIIFLFLTLFIMEQFESKDSFHNSPYSVNSKTSVSFGNKVDSSYGAFGKYPPNSLCHSCNLVNGSVNSPYSRINDLGDENGDLYGKVSLNCNSIYGKNYGNLDYPLLVDARSTGRPRQCMRIR